MKKVLSVMLVTLIAVSAVFAEFNKEDLSLDVRFAKGEGKGCVEAGLSYDYDKWNFGASASWDVASAIKVKDYTGSDATIYLLEDVKAFVTYDVLAKDKSNLALGAFLRIVEEPSRCGLGAAAEYSYSVNENSAVTARLIYQVNEIIGNGPAWYIDLASLTCAYGAIGYKYSF